jgi:hypothetical protein
VVTTGPRSSFLGLWVLMQLAGGEPFFYVKGLSLVTRWEATAVVYSSHVPHSKQIQSSKAWPTRAKHGIPVPYGWVLGCNRGSDSGRNRSGRGCGPSRLASRSFCYGRSRRCSPNLQVAARHPSFQFASMIATVIMLIEWRQFAAQHWIAGGILASLLWFLAGRQSLSNNKRDAAIAWQCVAVLILLIMSGWAVVQREWLGLAFGMAILYVEVRSIKRIAAAQSGPR